MPTDRDLLAASLAASTTLLEVLKRLSNELPRQDQNVVTVTTVAVMVCTLEKLGMTRANFSEVLDSTAAAMDAADRQARDAMR